MTYSKFNEADIESAPVAPWDLPTEAKDSKIHAWEEHPWEVETRNTDLQAALHNSAVLERLLHLLTGKVL